MAVTKKIIHYNYAGSLKYPTLTACGIHSKNITIVKNKVNCKKCKDSIKKMKFESSHRKPYATNTRGWGQRN